MKRPVGSKAYFKAYGWNGEPYGKHWGCVAGRTALRYWDLLHHVFGYAPEAFRIRSLLDIGAATGGLLEQISKVYDIDMYGVESSEWAERNVLPEWKSRIVFDTWPDCSKRFRQDQFDLVLDCVAHYLEEDQLDTHFGEMRRIAKMGIISYISAEDDQTRFHDTSRNLTYPLEWWRRRISLYSTEHMVIAAPTFPIIWR